MATHNVLYAQQGWAYAELPNPKKTNLKAWSKVTLPLYASFVSKNFKIAPNEPPQGFDAIDYAGETAWRGERISFQILLWSGKGASNLTSRISD